MDLRIVQSKSAPIEIGASAFNDAAAFCTSGSKRKMEDTGPNESFRI
jgi:hypothetical protein